MCGRYASFRQSQDLAAEFDVLTLSDAAAETSPSWNVAPTAPVRIVVDRSGSTERPSSAERSMTAGRSMHVARWGLVPRWADSLSIGARMINARSETVATKRSFQEPFRSSRCLVLADGYYEWHTDEAGKKTPYYIFPSSGASIAFAGLFSWWPDPGEPEGSPDRWVLTTTILTAPARDGLEQIHDREPVMLPGSGLPGWLDAGLTEPGAALEILDAPGPEMSWHPVSPAVGSVRNNSPALTRPVPPPPVQGALI